MAKAVPFLLLGAVAAFSVVFEAPSANSAPGKSAVDAKGSVSVTADLERSKMLRGQKGEVYARVLLQGTEAPPPKERLPISLTVVVDKSGSMGGDKIVNARTSAIAALEQLQPGDKAAVVSFGSRAQVLVEPITIGQDSLVDARRRLEGLGASGGTNMRDALTSADKVASMMFNNERTNRVLLLSDGQPDSAAGLDAQVATMAKKGILTTTLGIGRGYNEDLMAKLADAGLANYYFVENASQMAGIFAKELKDIATVVAKEAVVSVELQRGVEVKEVFGYRFSKGETVVAIPMGDIYAGRKAEVLMKLNVPASSGHTQLVDVKVTYHDALAGQARRVKQTLAATFIDNRQEVEQSANVAVFTKAEKVRTAEAMKRASQEAKAGRRSAARKILADQKARVQSYSSSFGAAAAPAAAEMEEALDDLDEEAASDKADMNVSSKKAKARARRMSR